MSSSFVNHYCDTGEFKDIDEFHFQQIDEQEFDKILLRNRPVILKNINFGDCTKNWNLDYLESKLKNETIVVHESSYSDLDFLSKNFKYKTCLFTEFSQKLRINESYLYLRSANKNIRAKKPARIEDDFPNLDQDLQPPSFIPYRHNSALYHSSVLRIASSKVQIWTHFDLYDNVLCQIVGTKRIILLPPEDTEYLYCINDKSPVNNFDDWEELLKLYPLMNKSTPYRCLLKPNDLIFIPALWWHNIRTVPTDASIEPYSIGFNIFWKDKALESELLYAQSDVYGNKNLRPYESALSNIDKAVEHLEKLPGKYKMFYKFLILEKLKSKLFPQKGADGSARNDLLKID